MNDYGLMEEESEEIERKEKELKESIGPSNWKNKYNCIFCNESTGECFFNVNWKCGFYCNNRVSFDPKRQVYTKEMFDKRIELLVNCYQKFCDDE